MGFVLPLSFFYLYASADGEIDASQAERLGQSCLSIAFPRSWLHAHTERDNDLFFSMHAAGVHRFIRSYQVNQKKSTFPYIYI